MKTAKIASILINNIDNSCFRHETYASAIVLYGVKFYKTTRK